MVSNRESMGGTRIVQVRKHNPAAEEKIYLRG